MALGMIEVYGFATSSVVADAAAKAGNVKIVAIENNKPAPAVVDTVAVPLVMCVRLEGDVAAVEAAVEAGSAAAKQRDLYITSHVISRAESDTNKLAYKNTLGRDKLYKHNKETK